jgi:hypothetical protein
MYSSFNFISVSEYTLSKLHNYAQKFTRNGGDARLRVVSSANHDSVVHLLLLPELPRCHRPPTAGLPPDTHHLRLEPYELVQIESHRERLQVRTREHLLVVREPAWVGGGDEGEVREAHYLVQ